MEKRKRADGLTGWRRGGSRHSFHGDEWHGGASAGPVVEFADLCDNESCQGMEVGVQRSLALLTPAGEMYQTSPASFSSQYFFFSSRRRHTSSYGDWSSDVCSSD